MKPLLRDHLADRMIVWIAHLSQAKDSLPALECYLDDRDRERAARFHFPDDRNRFVLGRALVRKSIGRYLEMAPEKVELAYTDLGRPFFPQDETIQFSISHTLDLVGIVLTAGACVGLDLESVHPNPDLPELAERIFSRHDLDQFHALTEEEKLAAFYRAWTGKEAYLKARGEGITEALQQISVSLGPEETSSIEDSRTLSPGKWRLLTLPVPMAYAGGLAYDDVDRQLEGAFVRFDRGEIVAESSF